MSTVTEIFSSMVFDDATMEARLPKETYKALQKTIKDGKHLDIGVANVVANAMKDWAIEKLWRSLLVLSTSHCYCWR